MVDVILYYLEVIGGFIFPYLPSLLNFLVIFIWVIIIRKRRLTFGASLKVCLVLLFVSMLIVIFSLKFIAGVIAEYAFIFLLVGIVQLIFQKSNHAKEI